MNPQLISVVAGRLVNNPERIRTAAGLRKYDRIVPDTGHGPERTRHLRAEPILKTALLVAEIVEIVEPIKITV